ncbi:hypothetical protein R4Q14_01430 [Brachyspira intermedia]|uniref:hypothetical protein n=1 Tax=Brachyspira intermedia TaxID=84377 RepID=UPI003006F660
MGFFDNLKSLHNMISDNFTDPESLKSKFEQESSDYLTTMYSSTGALNFDRVKREVIEEILDSRRDGFRYQNQLNNERVFKQIYSKFSEDELNSEYEYLKKNYTRVRFSMNIKRTKLRVLEEKLGITKNYNDSNKKGFNILKLLFRLIIFSIVIILGISLIYFIVYLIKNHFDISLSFNKLQLIYKAVFDKLVTIWPFK